MLCPHNFLKGYNIFASHFNIDVIIYFHNHIFYKVPGTKTEARIPDLIEGKTYQFRVKAVNKAGPGKPSAASENLLAKDRFGKNGKDLFLVLNIISF